MQRKHELLDKWKAIARHSKLERGNENIAHIEKPYKYPYVCDKMKRKKEQLDKWMEMARMSYPEWKRENEENSS